MEEVNERAEEKGDPGCKTTEQFALAMGRLNWPLENCVGPPLDMHGKGAPSTKGLAMPPSSTCASSWWFCTHQ
jgi:hypothetical protein